MSQKNPVYSFWNGKNIEGKQKFIDTAAETALCSECSFPCAESTETVGADEL